jgi:hypothetical protein
MSSKLSPIILIFIISAVLQVHAQNIDPVIGALYESISFSETQDPDYKTFKSLFIDGARLISVRDTTSYTFSPDEFEQAMNKQRKSGNMIAFEEYELHREKDQYGNILHVFSTYQTRFETPEGNNSTRGINSIQLMKEDGDWKIVSLIWYEENEAHPLPEQYLPSESVDGD